MTTRDYKNGRPRRQDAARSESPCGTGMASNFVPASQNSTGQVDPPPDGEIGTYEQAVAFLYSRVNYERIGHAPYTADHYRLDRMRRLLQALGHPHSAYPIVHVAGTKGKGTVCHLLAAALQASGYRTGLYTSPHLHRVEERFVVDGRSPDGSELAHLTSRVAAAARQIELAGGGRPTFFELTTAIGFLLFACRQVEVAILEVGLGGRLDSTNVCQPACCAITSISLDHQRQLGDTIAEIAEEKAGIIKPSIPVVCAARHPDAVEPIQRVAQQRGAPILTIGRDFECAWQPTDPPLDRQPEGGWARIRIDPAPPAVPRPLSPDQTLAAPHLPSTLGARGIVGVDLAESPVSSEKASPRADLVPPECWPVRLLGQHQADNVATAVTVLSVLAQGGWRIDWQQARQAISRVQPRGRLQVVGHRPLAIVDTAHNPASISAGLQALQQHFSSSLGDGRSRRLTAVFAASRDKDYRGMLRMLLSSCQHLVLTQYQQHPRALPMDRLAATVHELLADAESTLGEAAPTVHLAPTPAHAWQRAIELAESNGIVYACGSFFLAAELLPENVV
ncbi:MAG: bifunctional folylpolyglutamate synthase/dihydrofolate synthase [Planctomycetota bacterium]|nr:MAG: bifunctional folylpolyglutamate synthase/dihydrofolate synthase [Planctomycetota bacterium]